MMRESLDIAANRRAAKYTRFDLLRRILWTVVTPLFRFSPRICFGWRRAILRLFGASVGNHVHIHNTAQIYMPWNLQIGAWSSIGEYAFIYNLGKITIGEKTTVSHRAHLCAGTHDYSNPALPLRKLSVWVGDQVWVCTDSFVGPGITVGEGAVVGACAVVVKDIEAWTVVAGNPAKFIKKRVLINK
jgi:putative colanic acid biosynthesis acetyltransferase WcaF